MIPVLQIGSVTNCTDSTLKFLRSQEILRNGKLCDQCDWWMKHVACSEAGDGYFCAVQIVKERRMSEKGAFLRNKDSVFPFC